MNLREWLEWFKELPWSLRWFPLLIIIRPLVDSFYFLKEVSPFLSPPYLVGVLTPLAVITAFSKYRLPKFNLIDKAFAYWSVSVALSCLFLLLYDPLSLLSFEFVLKLAMPVYLYFFLRLLITDLRDLHGLLQCFLYSGIFVALLLVYEVFINPIGLEESRGLQRIQASFGDVVSYGMYIIFALCTAAYFFLSKQHKVTLSKRLWLLVAVIGFGLLGILNIHHTATYTVFALILSLFVLFNLRAGSRRIGFGLILLVGFAFNFWGSELVEERLTPLVETDLEVYSGAEDTDKLLHGRVGRWRLMLNKFSSEVVPVQFFGYPLKFEPVYQFIGIGSHNDFIRMLFATGIVGLLLYLNLLYRIWKELSGLGIAQVFLVTAVLLAMLFYSISVTPTFYAPFMYFALSVFAFVAIPKSQQSLWKNQPY